ncbi:uncharacterized protein LOC142570335 [Dermacentor variabilis]|uniref:uncharacterized protein LOC142570335 n=1 Tax=Dermacentor variabilis TaxID=34621 RepID=UPI003F5AF42D
MAQAQNARSPSPNYEGLSSTDHLLPDTWHRPSAAPWSARIYRLIGSPNTAGKEELVVVGLLAFMLLAGVIVGTAMLPKDSAQRRMAALKVKYNIPSGHILTTTTTTTTTATTTKKVATTKARDHKPPNETVAAKRAEEDHETDDAEETTTPTVEEQNESGSKKQGKVHRKPKTINKSARTPKRQAEASV